MKNIKQLMILIASSVALISGNSLPAQDWPQWRGPDRDGKVTGFSAPSVWPTNLTRKWQVTIGKGDASPVLSGTRLYAFGRQETDEVLLCLDPVTGKTVWEAKYPADRVVTAVGAPSRPAQHTSDC